MPKLKCKVVFLLALCNTLCTSQDSLCPQLPTTGDGLCESPEKNEEPLICVVIRTYRGHGERDFPYLEELLHSIRRQTFSR